MNELDNPQEVLSKEDWAYFAGVLDCDGCINAAKNSEARTYRISIIVVQKQPTLPQFLKETFGGYLGIVTRKHKSGKVGVYYRWMIVTKRAAQFLEGVLPYLRLKRGAAEYAIKLASLAYKRGGQNKRSTPDGVVNRQRALYHKIKAFNSPRQTPATTERDGSSKGEMRQSELDSMVKVERDLRSGVSA